jgi:hypothetical protein
MQKDKRLGFVMTAQEREAIRRLADAEGGLSDAATLRRLVRAAALARGMWPPVAERSELAEVKPA